MLNYSIFDFIKLYNTIWQDEHLLFLTGISLLFLLMFVMSIFAGKRYRNLLASNYFVSGIITQKILVRRPILMCDFILPNGKKFSIARNVSKEDFDKYSVNERIKIRYYVKNPYNCDYEENLKESKIKSSLTAIRNLQFILAILTILMLVYSIYNVVLVV